jgi:hypothetical protein
MPMAYLSSGISGVTSFNKLVFVKFYYGTECHVVIQTHRKTLEMKNDLEHKAAIIKNPIEVLRKLACWFDAGNWAYLFTEDSERPFILALARGEHATYHVMAYLNDDLKCVDFFSILGVRVPDGCLPKIWDFISRVNGDRCSPCLNIRDGSNEICAGARVLLGESTLTDDEIEVAVESVCGLIEACTPQILAVIFGREEPATAAANIKGYRHIVSQTCRLNRAHSSPIHRRTSSLSAGNRPSR